jgi:hypothetical protein
MIQRFPVNNKHLGRNETGKMKCKGEKNVVGRK